MKEQLNNHLEYKDGVPLKESINPIKMREKFKEANENRDYTIYERSMDTALEAKAKSIFPHFGGVGENSVIVDAGSGTGKLAEKAAQEFRGASVYALDISHELREHANDEKALAKPVFGNAIEQNFPDNSVDVKYFSTSGHEIESFGREGGMRKAIQNTLRELKPGGRLVIRDFAKPSMKEPIYMRILSKVGVDKVSTETKSEDIDYNLLSTSALFERFHQEFQDGNTFSYEEVNIKGEEYIKIDPEWAHEFYLRKDYTANWRQEIKEKYTYWTPEEAQNNLEEEGYVNVRVIPDPNEYILENRLKDKIALYQMADDELKEMDFPDTHMIIVAEKPTETVSGETGKIKKEMPKAINYKEQFSTIKIDQENKKVNIDKNEFVYESGPIVGTKKLIFRLSGEPPRILKIVRSDTYNDHNVFKSMYQIINRQNVLEKLETPHLKILEYDLEGPPYRYVVQEAATEDSVSAAELIEKEQITEEDIKQMAKIINTCEKSKEWQLDTNPYSWFRVKKEDGNFEWQYASSKVYRYDEQWEFRKIGLSQWLDSNYVKNGQNYSAAIPKAKEYKKLQTQWQKGSGQIDLWKKYLDPSLHPEVIEE